MSCVESEGCPAGKGIVSPLYHFTKIKKGTHENNSNNNSNFNTLSFGRDNRELR